MKSVPGEANDLSAELLRAVDASLCLALGLWHPAVRAPAGTEIAAVFVCPARAAIASCSGAFKPKQGVGLLSEVRFWPSEQGDG